MSSLIMIVEDKQTHLHGHDAHPCEDSAGTIVGGHKPQQHQAQGVEYHQHRTKPQLQDKRYHIVVSVTVTCFSTSQK